MNLAVKNFLKSVKIWQNYGDESVAPFFWPTLYIGHLWPRCFAFGMMVLACCYYFRSDEWQAVPDDEKESLGLTFLHDGESW